MANDGQRPGSRERNTVCGAQWGVMRREEGRREGDREGGRWKSGRKGDPMIIFTRMTVS